MLIVITYHYVRPDYSRCSEGINGVTPQQFETQLELLGRHGQFVSAEDIRVALEGGKELPERSLLVTFDDGLREQYEMALPILNRMGVPAIFFVNTRPIAEERLCTVHKVHLMRASVAPAEFKSALITCAGNRGIAIDSGNDSAKAALQYPYDTVASATLKYLINFALPLQERTELVNATFDGLFPGRERRMSREFYMSRGQVSDLMAAGFLGSHGHDHLPMAQLDEKRGRSMISRSLEHFERWTGARPYALSYPYGIKDTCSHRTARVAEEHGMRFGFTVETAGNDRESFRNPQFLGRFDCNLLPGGKCPSVKAETMFDDVAPARWHHVARIPDAVAPGEDPSNASVLENTKEVELAANSSANG